MIDPETTLAEWQRRAAHALDRWQRRLSDARPPEHLVTLVQVPDDLSGLSRRPEQG